MFDIAATRSLIKAFVASNPAPRFVLYNANWCPDCVRGVPPARATIEAAKLPLLVVDVGEPSEWRNPAHPLRTDPIYKINGVPTLMTLDDDGTPGAVCAAELEKAPTPEAAQKIVARFILAAVEAAKKGESSA